MMMMMIKTSWDINIKISWPLFSVSNIYIPNVLLELIEFASLPFSNSRLIKTPTFISILKSY
jgi:hypothetical protein